MKEEDSWRPSKFVEHNGLWVGSRDHAELGRGSRFIGDIIAVAYERTIAGHASGDLLDLGCGKVPLFGMYRPLVSSVTCVDWPNSLHGGKHVDQFVDLNGPLPFNDSAFDTVLATDLLEHIAKPDALFGEMGRVLRPGGKIIVGVPFLYPIHEEPHDYHRYTEFKLQQLCDDTGLCDVGIEPYGGALEVILDILGKHLYRHRRLSRIHLVTSRLLRKLKPLTAISEDTQRQFPLGYCMVARKPTTKSSVSGERFGHRTPM